MNNTRIRYTLEGTRLVSNEFVSTTLNDAVKALLYPSELRYTVTRTDGRILSEGTAVSLVMLKKMAKQAMVDNGVSFLSEYRKKRTTTTESTTLENVA